MEISHGIIYGIECKTEMCFEDGDSRRHTALEYNFFTTPALAWDYLNKMIEKLTPDAKACVEVPDKMMQTEEEDLGYKIIRTYRIATICVYDSKIDLK